jgi:hypothetical protein
MTDKFIGSYFYFWFSQKCLCCLMGWGKVIDQVGSDCFLVEWQSNNRKGERNVIPTRHFTHARIFATYEEALAYDEKLQVEEVEAIAKGRVEP